MEDGSKKEEPMRSPSRSTGGAGLTPELMKALNHPLRRRILRRLHNLDESQSPAQLRRQFDIDIGHVSYHMKVLKDFGFVTLTRTRPSRGALEHFYASAISDNSSVALVLKATKAEDESQ